jgi:hypothetical protein
VQIDSLGEAVLLMCIFAVALLAALELGYRGARREERRNEAEKKQPHRGTGTVEAAVLGLLGLILAFGLSGSQSRYDDQRKLLVERVNAIADAHDLTIVLPADERASIRTLLRRYVDEQIAGAATGSDPQEIRDRHRVRAAALERTILIRGEIACRTAGSSCAQLLLPAINKIADQAFARLAVQQSHTSWAIYLLVALLGACAAYFAGFSLESRGKRRWVHRIIYVMVLSSTLYVTLEVEFPRWGLIKLGITEDVAFDELRRRLE